MISRNKLARVLMDGWYYGVFGQWAVESARRMQESELDSIIKRMNEREVRELQSEITRQMEGTDND